VAFVVANDPQMPLCVKLAALLVANIHKCPVCRIGGITGSKLSANAALYEIGDIIGSTLLHVICKFCHH
jgi:hypothetical protein